MRLASTGVPAAQRCQARAGGPDHRGRAGSGAAQRAAPWAGRGRAGAHPWEGLAAASKRGGGVPRVICHLPLSCCLSALVRARCHSLHPASCFPAGEYLVLPLASPTPRKQEAAIIPGRDEAHVRCHLGVLRHRLGCARPLTSRAGSQECAIHSQLTLLLAPESPSCSTGREAASHGAPMRTWAPSPWSPHTHSAEMHSHGRICGSRSAIMKTPCLVFLLIANMISNTSFS